MVQTKIFRVLGFPRGEAGFFDNRHFGTDCQKRLMRGCDRLVNKCSWMSGICSGFLHSTGKSETFSYRRPSSVTTKTTVPKCRCFVATASPRGKPRTQKPLAATIQCEFRISKLATPTMLLLLTMVPIFLTYTIVLIFPWIFLTVTV